MVHLTVEVLKDEADWTDATNSFAEQGVTLTFLRHETLRHSNAERARLALEDVADVLASVDE